MGKKNKEKKKKKAKNIKMKDTSRVKKIKTIQILIDWENKIKMYYGGTVSGYITTAIQEKMQRDKIL